ncbi:hypothetical protein NA57DRAFT_54437 [Rhizodiscina lignyota]|uniref:Uncharacterized protein n=1 Tax=Rhizodiscina lignyota TaxID=1504668 RepID=A0A9P4M753_9PEZI|nr:hypothetical protein NA57DRAFT_54437 [Rhizodiscina lignyota]
MAQFKGNLQKHPAVKPGLCRRGEILWLPKLKHLAPTPYPVYVPDGCFSHPVIVLDYFPEIDQVDIFTVTSFHNTDFQLPQFGSQTHYGSSRTHFLPLPPALPHPDTGLMLEMEDISELWCASWVNTKHVYRVPRTWLGNLWRGRGRLCEESMKAVEVWHLTFGIQVPSLVSWGLQAQCTQADYVLPHTREAVEEGFVAVKA